MEMCTQLYYTGNFTLYRTCYICEVVYWYIYIPNYIGQERCTGAGMALVWDSTSVSWHCLGCVGGPGCCRGLPPSLLWELIWYVGIDNVDFICLARWHMQVGSNGACEDTSVKCVQTVQAWSNFIKGVPNNTRTSIVYIMGPY